MAQVVSDTALAALDTLPGASVTATAEVLLHYGVPAGQIRAPDLLRFGAADFTVGANRIPGVRIESRAPGSYRVLLRNTARRSPFGVRDVRVYWNQLMLTEPGGDTRLNFVDLANVDGLTADKGPFVTTAGNPLGGVLQLSTYRPEAAGASASVQVGSFGQVAASGTARFGDSPSEVRLSHRQGDNYRAHSALSRSTAQVSLYAKPFYGPDTAWRISSATHVLATRLDYELPGALTPELYAEDPRLARPGSAEAEAAIDYENVLIGTAVEARRGGWELRAAPQLSGYRFDNPFNVNHKRETNVGLGVRGSARWRPRMGGLSVRAGGEFQTDFRDARQYDPNGGTPGELQYSDDVTTQRGMGYLQADGFLPDTRFRYGFGASLTQQRYTVERTYQRDGAPSAAVSDFAPFFAPHASIEFARPNGGPSIGLRVARGSSAPTLSEFRTNEGSLNAALRPEEGLSAELQFVYVVREFLDLRANLYHTRLSETITTFQDASDVQLFRNSGSADQSGLELAARWYAFRQNGGTPREATLAIAPSYTYQRYRYRDYSVRGVSFAGNAMPGAPTHALDVLVTYEKAWNKASPTANSFRADLNVRHESATPLNDGGTVEADAFTVVRFQVAYEREGRLRENGRRGSFTLSAGVDNLTDVTYSLGNDINPQFGNRYFQPAPGRNWFLRAAVRL